MSDVTIRELLPGELPAIAALYGESFNEPYPEPVAASLLRTPGAWCHLAFEPGAAVPAGFLIGRVTFDEAEILSVGVLREARRRGIASALLEAGFATARRAGARTMHLEVGEDNPGAAALYRLHGFRATGRRANYYRRADRSRVAAILMSCTITSDE